MSFVFISFSWFYSFLRNTGFVGFLSNYFWYLKWTGLICLSLYEGLIELKNGLRGGNYCSPCVLEMIGVFF